MSESEINPAYSIHIGSYEGVLIGFEGTSQNMENKYSFLATTGSIKTICNLNKYLFVGGFDEIIKIYNLRKKREEGQLEGHEGSIICLKGYQNYLFSGGEDGNICVWRVKDWALMHKIKAHKKSVNDFTIHSSGRILISISKDRKMHIWNLLNFQKTFSRKFSYDIQKIAFNQKEDLIIIMSEKTLHLLNILTNKMENVFEHEAKLNDFIVFGEHYLISGDEEGLLYIWDLNTKFNIKFKAHDNRVKQIKIFSEKDYFVLITCSTDGKIKLWDILYLISKIKEIEENKNFESEIQPVITIDSRERITSLEISKISANINQNEEPVTEIKKKKKNITQKIKNILNNDNKNDSKNKKKNDKLIKKKEKNKKLIGKLNFEEKSKKIKIEDKKKKIKKTKK